MPYALCTGSNVIPANIFPSKVTPALLEELVLMAKESNQNMLRVWGGGMYPLDGFYEATDANGIMVWQESMFACAMYPANDAFLREVCVSYFSRIAITVVCTMSLSNGLTPVGALAHVHQFLSTLSPFRCAVA
jgi:beta-galactosidase/beta-glucuronidase